MSSVARLALVVSLGATAILASCTTQKVEPKQGTYKVGSAYQVNGQWYYPRENSSYDETGIASWYGDDFHGKSTANGEAFDMETMTAAHRTLPMPTLVRVTNLENGRSVQLRVNDRGPFKPGRIIDVSSKAADLLGFRNNGIAKVRVQYLGRAPLDPRVTVVDYATPRGQEIATAAPRTEVSSSALAPPPGTSAAPMNARPTAAPAMTPANVAAAAPPPAVVTVVPVPTHADIYVQAGAFKSSTNARQLEARVGTLGRTSVAPATIDGEQFHRVRIGPFKKVEEADSLLAKLLGMGIKGAKIVID